MNLPRVLILSTIPDKASEIAIKMGAESVASQDEIRYYLWNIDNKYYTSQVLLCIAENPSIDISTESIEALIVHHDPQAENAEQNLDKWSTVISSLCKLEVLLFSCNSIPDAHLKDKVIDWCMHRKFELIELVDKDSIDILEYDLEHNKYGIDRIIEALHAHMWPNMTLKKKSNFGALEADINNVEEQFENIQLIQDPSERLQMESVLDGLMGGENADFGELFGQLTAMKEHAASLPTNERRIAAEQLVTAFWKAMGGDPSEIDD